MTFVIYASEAGSNARSAKYPNKIAYVREALNIPKRIYIAILLAVCAISYLLALQGGDLEYVKDHLDKIGLEVVISVLSLTAVIVILYTCKLRSGTRRGVLLFIPCLFAALYIYDHGERFEQHGFYNLLVFLAIFIPLNIALATLYILYIKVKHFTVYFIIALVVGGATTAVSLWHYRKIFDEGIRGALEYNVDECRWVGRNIPFIDLLPTGAQNFWAGLMYCKPEQQDIHAIIDQNGRLRVDCGIRDSDIVVDVLPETREWPLRDKDYWKNLNKLVIKRTIRLPYKYTIPFILNDTTQAVIVRCGSSSTIVSRVSPPISKLPLYTPPLESDTRTINANEVFNISSSWEYTEQKPPNVIYLMLDAVSRRQFHRRLPQSVRVLRTLQRLKYSHLTELYRYHSVGFSTDNNTKAAYLGEIFPKQRNTLPIWAHFRDRGFVTARIESGCDDWTKGCNGNNYENQDFAASNRTLDYELIAPFCQPEYYPNVGNAFGNFKGPYSIIARCLFGKYVHDWAFDYLYKLRRELRPQKNEATGVKNRPYMITATFFEGHEGTGEVIRTLDSALAAFLEDIRDSGELNDTVLIVAADHGLHMGLNFAYLQNGRIEHQNPFFAMSVPKWLHQFTKTLHPENENDKHKQSKHKLVDNEKRKRESRGSKWGDSSLDINEQRLITPFELHHAFRVLAEWPRFSMKSWKKSLFYPQKKGRTCKDAGIDSAFCMCEKP
ncbi:hypothetical protein H4R24_000170 [Coemansia sp. RSA 988]|nr:hypothetical protein H4R24_000170 [Coemansia sp. RSA 988]